MFSTEVKIYALVYYGRRSYVDILNAYLERNLRTNGGVLDGVIFAMVKYTMEERHCHSQRRSIVA